MELANLYSSYINSGFRFFFNSKKCPSNGFSIKNSEFVATYLVKVL